jgi:TolA-binding protein
MMFRRFSRLIACVLLAAPLPALAAASKEYQELQREIAQLQDMVKKLQSAQEQTVKSQNDKLAALQRLVQQSLEAAADLGKAVAAVETNVRQDFRDVQDKLLPPVAQLSTRVGSMSDDFATLQDAVAEMNTLNGRIQSQLTELNNYMKVLPVPAAPPPTPAGGAPSTAAIGPPPLSARDMLTGAEGDRMAAHYDLALQDYADFMKYYGDTPDSSEALYYIGYIHYLQKDYETAANDFDAVVAKSPGTNARVPLALLYKVRSLVKLNRGGAAAAGYRELLKQYPNDRNVKAACGEFKSLGIECPGSRAPSKASTRKK